jgi:hypothetical protein
MSQFRSEPPERIIDNDGDGLKSLRALRDRYLSEYGRTESPYYLGAASCVNLLIDEPVPDAENLE